MCLQKSKPDKRKTATGYKYLIATNKNLTTFQSELTFSNKKRAVYRLNVEAVDVKPGEPDENKTGFHVFEELKGAKDWGQLGGHPRGVIVKVKCSELRVKGFQLRHKAFTCNRMTILKVTHVRGKTERLILRKNRKPKSSTVKSKTRRKSK